jgi:hypothetical protein
LRPSWSQILTLSLFLVACFSFVMGTIGSRHGLATLRGCIAMIENGITQWIASAWIQEAREA